MKITLKSNKKGQFTIIAALLVAVILVVAVLTTYSAVRYSTVGNQPQVLTSVDETNNALRQLLGFTVAYYGSIMNVTGNYQFAYGNASNYLNSGLEYIANANPELGLSFKVTNLDLHVTWFMSSSYSHGQLNVTYDLAGLGLYGLTFSPESKLGVQILSSDSTGHSLVSVIQNENEPLNGLVAQNFVFFTYQNSTMDWQQTPSTVQAVLSNGTYLLNIPAGVNPAAYQIQVTDARGISVTASSFSQYNSTLNLNSAALRSALTQNTATIEVLQNGAMRWLGQNLNLTSQLPIPRLPVKDIHVNQTFTNGTNKEVSFQIEDWASNYSVPLGLTNGYTVFSNNQMIVYQISAAVTHTAIWWNGSDVIAQTPYAYTPGPFNDNVIGNALNNGKLAIQFNGGFNVASTVGGVSSTASFMRINNYTSDYGAGLAYVITNAPVRDIVQQEAEWGSSHLATSCPNIYANMVLTLPAGASYYTYQLKLMFTNSTNQPRNITDLSPIQLTSSPSSLTIQTENGIVNNVPIVVNGSGTFYNYNYPDGSTQHHWSQIINNITGTGSGIMFTDSTNQQLYALDTVAPAGSKGALNVSTLNKVIEFSPVTLRGTVSSYKTPNSNDLTWYGAVATFDSSSTPIYSNTDGTPTGLWPIVDQPPAAITATNAVTSAQCALSPNNGSVGTSITISGSGFTCNSVLTVMYDQNIVAISRTDSYGLIPSGLAFNIPSSIAGSHSVTAVDSNSSSASTTFFVMPSITTSPSTGNVGSAVTVSGSGFAPNSVLTANFAGSSVGIGGSTSTDSTGSFSAATLSVPISTSGQKTLTINDSTNPTINYAQTIFSVTSSISLSPNSGTPGTTVTVTGTGYGPSKTITIRFDGTLQTTTPVTINSGTTGSFTGSFSVPSSSLGGHTVNATDGTYSSTAAFTVNAGTLAKFALNNVADQIAGTAFQITITAQDTNGNTISGYSSSIGLSVSGGGTIMPSVTGTSGWSGSVWTGLVTLSKSGSGLTVTVSDGVHSGISNSFTVGSGALNKFAFNAISAQTAGTSYQVTVTAQDANGNTVSSYVGNPSLTSSSWVGSKTLGAFVGGTKTGSVTSTVAGSTTITATDGAITGTCIAFVVNPGALGAFTLSAITSPQTAGIPIASVTITAVDANGNKVTSYVSSTALTETAGGVGGSITQSPIAFVNGTWSGSLTVTKSGSGVTITASCGGKTGASGSFNVNPGNLDHFDFSVINSPQTAGTAFSVTITAKDANGNTVPSYLGTNTLSISSGTISPTSTTAFTAGVWTGSVTLYTSGSSITIGTIGSAKIGTSNTITVNVGSGTFGNTVSGSSTYQISIENNIAGSVFTTPAYSVTAQSISAYIHVTGTTYTMKAAIYTTSGALVSGLSTQAVTVTTANDDAFVTFAYSGTKPTLAANTSYVIVVWSNSQSGYSAYLYGSSNSGVGRIEAANYGTWPSPISSWDTSNTRNYSIYCTYSIP
jgi:hypothetical protein